MKLRNRLAVLVACLAAAVSGQSLAAEHSMGAPVIVDGMILQPVYLQPVHMAPMLPGMSAESADSHLEIDIHADKNNPQGFEPGAWIPYLTVSYQIRKLGGNWSTFGTLMAMTSSERPRWRARATAASIWPKPAERAAQISAPRGVARIPPGRRSKRARPSAPSALATCWLTAPGLTRSSVAAARSAPMLAAPKT